MRGVQSKLYSPSSMHFTIHSNQEIIVMKAGNRVSQSKSMVHVVCFVPTGLTTLSIEYLISSPKVHVPCKHILCIVKYFTFLSLSDVIFAEMFYVYGLDLPKM